MILSEQNKLEFVYGTGNQAKLNFMRDCLAPLDIEIVGLNDISIAIPDVDENGNTPLENARIKAFAYYNVLKRPVFACDSGLYIDGLLDSEQPGVYVRRVNGKHMSDDEMIIHYASVAKRLGGKTKACYKNAICLILNDSEVYEHFGDDLSSEAFYLTDTPHPKRIEGFPLDSLSMRISNGKYYFDSSSTDNCESGISDGFCSFFRDVLEKTSLI